MATPAAPDRKMDAMATNLSTNAAESSLQRSDSPASQRILGDAIICKMDSFVVVSTVHTSTEKPISEKSQFRNLTINGQSRFVSPKNADKVLDEIPERESVPDPPPNKYRGNDFQRI